MVQAIKSPVAVGAMAFIASMLIIGAFMGPTTCNSGWQSGSIGRQGACSHHGGVNRTPGTLRFMVSLGVGIWAGIIVARRRDREAVASPFLPFEKGDRPTGRSEPRSIKTPEPATGVTGANTVHGTTCHSCGFTMRGFSEKGRIVLRCSATGCDAERRIR